MERIVISDEFGYIDEHNKAVIKYNNFKKIETTEKFIAIFESIFINHKKVFCDQIIGFDSKNLLVSLICAQHDSKVPNIYGYKYQITLAEFCILDIDYIKCPKCSENITNGIIDHNGKHIDIAEKTKVYKKKCSQFTAILDNTQNIDKLILEYSTFRINVFCVKHNNYFYPPADKFLTGKKWCELCTKGAGSKIKLAKINDNNTRTNVLEKRVEYAYGGIVKFISTSKEGTRIMLILECNADGEPHRFTIRSDYIANVDYNSKKCSICQELGKFNKRKQSLVTSRIAQNYNLDIKNNDGELRTSLSKVVDNNKTQIANLNVDINENQSCSSFSSTISSYDAQNTNLDIDQNVTDISNDENQSCSSLSSTINNYDIQNVNFNDNIEINMDEFNSSVNYLDNNGLPETFVIENHDNNLQEKNNDNLDLLYNTINDMKKIKKTYAKNFCYYLVTLDDVINDSMPIICSKLGHFLSYQTKEFHNTNSCQDCLDKKQYTNFEEIYDKFLTVAHIMFGDNFTYKFVGKNAISNNIEVQCTSCNCEKFTTTYWKHLSSETHHCDNFTPIKFIRYFEYAAYLHGNRYIYNKKYFIGKFIEYECPIHGIYSQDANDHIRGGGNHRGCKKCGIISCGNTKRHSGEEFIVAAKEAQLKANGDKPGFKPHDYSLVKYVNNITKIILICHIHGPFMQIPSNTLSGCWCSLCSYNYRSETYIMSNKKFITKSKLRNPGVFLYDLCDYKGYRDFVILICIAKKHKIKQMAGANLRGNGCYKCLLCPSCELFATNGVLCSYCKLSGEIKNTTSYKTIKKLTKNIGMNITSFKITDGKLLDNIHNIQTNEKLHKKHESNVLSKINDNIKEENIYNKKVQNKNIDSVYYFPDIRYVRDSFDIIIEVDEKQHSGYSCDEKRMLDIVAILHKPCIFIRYNPDNVNANIDVLINKIDYYLNVNYDEISESFNKYGIKVEYLYYTKKINNIDNNTNLIKLN